MSVVNNFHKLYFQCLLFREIIQDTISQQSDENLLQLIGIIGKLKWIFVNVWTNSLTINGTESTHKRFLENVFEIVSTTEV